MKKLPTKVSEKVYSLLCKFAEAKQDYYSREQFVFHFGVVKNTSDDFRLDCMDGVSRTFICKENGQMWIVGKGSDRVNPILRKITKELYQDAV